MGEAAAMVIHQDNTAVATTIADDFLPIMSIDQAVARRNHIVSFVKRIMTPDVDFGKIPGTTKDVLLKPGAEKLCVFFGLSPEFESTSTVEDWSGENHAGEPFFYYKYRCRLSRNGRILGDGEGSCNSRESKYRYRSAERACPTCGKATIIKGKEEYGGGWICFAKKGGCGAKFKAGDKSIEGQSVGRIANPDIADVVNTIQKMAQKRALVAATLIATSASEFYSQDIEDEPPTGLITESLEPPAEIPPALPAFNLKEALAEIGEFRTAFVELLGSDIEYYAALHQNDVKSKDDLKRIDLDKGRRILVDLRAKLESVKKSLELAEETVSV